MEVWVVFDGDQPDSAVLGLADTLDTVYTMVMEALYKENLMVREERIELPYSNAGQFKCMAIEYADKQSERCFVFAKHRLTTAS